MADTPDFKAGRRQGDAERMVWVMRKAYNARDLTEFRKCVDDETRRIFPEYYEQARK